MEMKIYFFFAVFFAAGFFAAAFFAGAFFFTGIFCSPPSFYFSVILNTSKKLLSILFIYDRSPFVNRKITF